MTDFVIDDADKSMAATLESELLSSLVNELPQAINTNFVLAAHQHTKLLGGICATTSYGWLLIKVLWVNEEYRRSGIGATLVREAERRARSVDCHGAWLDTSRPSSVNFYEALGYSVFATLSNDELGDPSGHQRWFLKKEFRDTG